MQIQFTFRANSLGAQAISCIHAALLLSVWVQKQLTALVGFCADNDTARNQLILSRANPSVQVPCSWKMHHAADAPQLLNHADPSHPM